MYGAIPTVYKNLIHVLLVAQTHLRAMRLQRVSESLHFCLLCISYQFRTDQGIGIFGTHSNPPTIPTYTWHFPRSFIHSRITNWWSPEWKLAQPRPVSPSLIIIDCENEQQNSAMYDQRRTIK